jgi:KDO2-lipid IV(A) lauroyltransferase
MVVRESIVRDILRLIIWYPFRWFILILPFPAAFYMLKVMGDTHYLFSGNKKRIIRETLSMVFNGRDSFPLNRILKMYFENHYIDHLHIFLYPRFNKKTVEKYFSVHGLENLNSALSHGRGCILLQGHFGPIQIPLFVLALKGYNVKQIGYLWKPENLSLVGERVSFRLRARYESMIPAEILSAKSFLRSAFEILKDNGIIMMNGDGAAGKQFIGKHIPVRFLGKEVLFPVGAINLARRTRSPILPLFIVRESPWRFRIVIEKPSELNYTREETDMGKGVEEFVRVFEGYVKRYPCHWHLWDEFKERIFS